MKFIVFAKSIYLDILSNKGTESFLEDTPEFCAMTYHNDEDKLLSLKKVERYGSFCFISENKYDKIKDHTDEI